MPTIPPDSNQFPASEFDDWALQYDQDVLDQGFPFTGYQQVLAETVRLADTRAGMRILDLGIGTGNLAELFLPLGCILWGTDFSSKMIELAQAKLPQARLFLHDLRQPFPAALLQRFERIVSAYTFHHFEIPEKIIIIQRIMNDLLAPDGRLVIADISFPDRRALDAVRMASGDQWEEEAYWIVAETLPILREIQIDFSYAQISDCAGIYVLSRCEKTLTKIKWFAKEILILFRYSFHSERQKQCKQRNKGETAEKNSTTTGVLFLSLAQDPGFAGIFLFLRSPRQQPRISPCDPQESQCFAKFEPMKYASGLMESTEIRGFVQ